MAEQHPNPKSSDVVLSWEPLGQIKASELPAPSEEYPGPWQVKGRGNGHEDIYDGKDRYFAHIYCWDSKDWDALEKKVIAAKLWAEARGA